MQEHRVYGPPGTGKTTYLAKCVQQAADYYGSGRVMVCSFTTAAAANIAGRDIGLPDENVGTLHKACYAALGRLPVIEGKVKEIKEWNAYAPAYAFSIGGCSDYNSGLEYGDSATVGDRLFTETTILRNKLVLEVHWPENCQNFYARWKAFKYSKGAIDYTDMLEYALCNVERAPSNPAIIFVDEAQDCTALQFAVLKQWGYHCEKLVMVGDADQCIYQFAGATPDAFEASEMTANDKLLSQSYRVPKAVHGLATKWIGLIPKRLKKEYHPTATEGFVERAPYNWKNGKELADLCHKILNKGFTVMAIGTCSYMIEPLKRALIEAGMPFHNPYRLIRADWNPLRLEHGTTYAQRLTAFLSLKYENRITTRAEFRSWASVMKAEGVFKKGRKGKLEDIEADVKLEYPIVSSFLTDEAMERWEKADYKWWYQNLVNDEARQKADYSLRVYDKWGIGFLDSEYAPIVIGTIHSVKGGEADVVILFPDLSQVGMQEWTGGGQASIRRIMYVGMTRAREGLVICRPASSYNADL